MNVIHLRDRVARTASADDEERTLTPVERALAELRLAAFSALTAGANRGEVDREVAEATRIHLRMTGGHQ